MGNSQSAATDIPLPNTALTNTILSRRSLPDLSEPSKKPISPPSAPPLDPSKRARRQIGLFAGGLAFAAWSALLTRRSLAKRRLPTSLVPTTHGNTTAAGQIAKQSQSAASKAAAEEEALAAEEAVKASGPLLAAEALSLATINVFSWAVMVAGGLMWYHDIATKDELRAKIRGGLGIHDTMSEEEADEEMEQWIARTLDRRDKKDPTAKGKRRRDEW